MLVTQEEYFLYWLSKDICVGNPKRVLFILFILEKYSFYQMPQKSVLCQLLTKSSYILS